MGNCASTEEKKKLPATYYETDVPDGPPPESYLENMEEDSRLSSGSGSRTSSAKIKKLVALYDYDGTAEGDLAFKEGDILILVEDEDSDWWLALNTVTKQQGYVPSNYVAQQDQIVVNSWFLGKIGRKDAEKQLLQPGLPPGTFLVRESETVIGAFSLSLRDFNTQKGHHTKHYKIYYDQNGFSISERNKFSSLEQLVDYYRVGSNGLSCALTQSCPKPKPQMWDISKQTRDKWEIDRDTLEFQKKLGAGMFGEVWKAKFNGKVHVAVKTLKAGTMDPDAFLQEAQIMKTCRHKNLVQLYAVCTEKEPIFIITEFMENGSLLDYLRHGVGRHIKFADIIDMAGQIASGMSYLEAKKFIHRDLAARNVLVGRNKMVKIGDFGLARVLHNTDEYNPQEGAKFPIKWTSPEAASFGRFTIKSDVWSFGILMVEIITRGQIPYPGMTNREVLEAVASGYRIPRPNNCPEPLYDILRQCWHYDADARPTFEYLQDFFEAYLTSTEGQYEADYFNRHHHSNPNLVMHPVDMYSVYNSYGQPHPKPKTYGRRHVYGVIYEDPRSGIVVYPWNVR